MNNLFIRKGIRYLSRIGLFNWLGDKNYIKLYYWATFNKTVNIDNPTTYNEKLQWLKLNDRNPKYTIYVDKYRVREYVAKEIGEEYLVPLLGHWSDPEEIDFDKLPKQFVLKWNHDSGSIVICKNKENLDLVNTVKYFKKRKRRNVYKISREWPYKNVVPEIIAEQYLVDSATKELRDYKLYLFNGKVRLIMVNSGRQRGVTTADYFDENYNWLDLRWGYPNANIKPEKPRNFVLMKELATKLGKSLIGGRIDFYEVDGKVYFGEITFFDGSGFSSFDPSDWDQILGSWLKLPSK